MASLTRRSFVAGSTATAIAFTLRGPALAAGRDVYRDAIVIDGLGGLGNSAAEENAPLADTYIQDVRSSGLTCVHTTILPVGSTPPDAPSRRPCIGIETYEREIDRHPDTLAASAPAADIAAAKQSLTHGPHVRVPGRGRLRD